jgi:hypothetical protein
MRQHEGEQLQPSHVQLKTIVLRSWEARCVTIGLLDSVMIYPA